MLDLFGTILWWLAAWLVGTFLLALSAYIIVRMAALAVLMARKKFNELTKDE